VSIENTIIESSYTLGADLDEWGCPDEGDIYPGLGSKQIVRNTNTGTTYIVNSPFEDAFSVTYVDSGNSTPCVPGCEGAQPAHPIEPALLSRHRPATQSDTAVESEESTAIEGIASFAVDGNSAPEFAARTCTLATSPASDPSVPAWWRVDLGEKYVISTVKVFNRVPDFGKLNGFRVGVGDDANGLGTPCGVSVRCQWQKHAGKVVHQSLASDAVDIVGHNPDPTPAATEADCQAMCEVRLDCEGYSWRSGGGVFGDETHSEYHKCFLVSTYPPSDGVAAAEFSSGKCIPEVAPAGLTEVVNCGGRAGQYVTVSQNTDKALTLCEVEVYGVPPPPPPPEGCGDVATCGYSATGRTVMVLDATGRANSDTDIFSGSQMVSYNLAYADMGVRFKANTDQNTEVEHRFPHPVYADRIRFVPTKYHNAIAMRTRFITPKFPASPPPESPPLGPPPPPPFGNCFIERGRYHSDDDWRLVIQVETAIQCQEICELSKKNSSQGLGLTAALVNPTKKFGPFIIGRHMFDNNIRDLGQSILQTWPEGTYSYYGWANWNRSRFAVNPDRYNFTVPTTQAETDYAIATDGTSNNSYTYLGQDQYTNFQFNNANGTRLDPLLKRKWPLSGVQDSPNSAGIWRYPTCLRAHFVKDTGKWVKKDVPELGETPPSQRWVYEGSSYWNWNRSQEIVGTVDVSGWVKVKEGPDAGRYVWQGSPLWEYRVYNNPPSGPRRKSHWVWRGDPDWEWLEVRGEYMWVYVGPTAWKHVWGLNDTLVNGWKSDTNMAPKPHPPSISANVSFVVDITVPQRYKVCYFLNTTHPVIDHSVFNRFGVSTATKMLISNHTGRPFLEDNAECRLKMVMYDWNGTAHCCNVTDQETFESRLMEAKDCKYSMIETPKWVEVGPVLTVHKVYPWYYDVTNYPQISGRNPQFTRDFTGKFVFTHGVGLTSGPGGDAVKFVKFKGFKKDKKGKLKKDWISLCKDPPDFSKQTSTYAIWKHLGPGHNTDLPSTEVEVVLWNAGIFVVCYRMKGSQEFRQVGNFLEVTRMLNGRGCIEVGGLWPRQVMHRDAMAIFKQVLKEELLNKTDHISLRVTKDCQGEFRELGESSGPGNVDDAELGAPALNLLQEDATSRRGPPVTGLLFEFTGVNEGVPPIDDIYGKPYGEEAVDHLKQDAGQGKQTYLNEVAKRLNEAMIVHEELQQELGASSDDDEVELKNLGFEIVITPEPIKAPKEFEFDTERPNGNRKANWLPWTPKIKTDYNVNPSALPPNLPKPGYYPHVSGHYDKATGQWHRAPPGPPEKGHRPLNGAGENGKPKLPDAEVQKEKEKLFHAPGAPQEHDQRLGEPEVVSLDSASSASQQELVDRTAGTEVMELD
jgi:hypothetical protein